MHVLAEGHRLGEMCVRVIERPIRCMINVVLRYTASYNAALSW